LPKSRFPQAGSKGDFWYEIATHQQAALDKIKGALTDGRAGAIFPTWSHSVTKCFRISLSGTTNRAGLADAGLRQIDLHSPNCCKDLPALRGKRLPAD
jgi:hypothetical protein